MKRYLLPFALLLLLGVTSCNSKSRSKNQHAPKRYVVMLSLDGFRWDYQDLYNTPVLDSISRVGVRAESMKPIFPSKTFPNHYSLATGLYADGHGIVLNNFYAEDLGKDYNKKDKSTVGEGAFYGGEPLWNTAVKNHLKSATLFWVGSEADVQGIRPTYWKKYNQEMPFEARIDTVIHWLNLPYAQRPHLVMWYYHEPDHTSHGYGPESKETKQVVEQIDSWLGDFFREARQLPIYDSIDFIIVSDHGMAELSQEKQVILDEYIDTADLARFDGWNPNYNLQAKAGNEIKVWNALKKIPHVQVWKRGTLPKRLNYGKNLRIYSYVLVAEPGWSVYWSWQQKNGKGAHGYDNDFKDMQAIFYALGPDFKVGYRQPAFPNVDVYPLVSKLLGVKPAPNNGKINDVEGMLK